MTAPGSGSPVIGGLMAGSPLRWAGIALGLASLAGVLTLQLSDALLATGRPQAALTLPGSSARAATLMLPGMAAKPATAQGMALAHRALANSPLASEALTYLAVDLQRQGKAEKAMQLLRLAGATGWHDETTGRQLYNAALSAGDVAAALRHADAMLRQGLARDELFGQFVRAAEVPVFRKGLIPYLTTPAGWGADWLAIRGASLSDAAIADILGARAQALGGLDRAVVRPLSGALVARGRHAAAVAVWRLVKGADGLGPGRLVWISDPAFEQPTPFDWQFGEGYRIEKLDLDRLTGAPSDPTARAARLIALPAGNWRLETERGEVAMGWRWSVTCPGQAAVPMLPLGGGAAFTVAPGCPVQVLALSVPLNAAVSPEPLAALMLAKVQSAGR